MKLQIGCCGFPKAREEYYRHFALVELQQTFYKPPQVETARRWRQTAPAGFEFSLKVWQLITHESTSPTYRKAKLKIPAHQQERYGAFRPTGEVFRAWEQTKEIALALGSRIVVFQCPASFTPTEEHKANLRTFFKDAKRDGLAFVWEPRGEWTDREIQELCADLDLVHGVDPFVRRPVHGPFAYFRLHGIGGYRYRYTQEDLSRLARWCQEHGEVYCLFNNTNMFEDAQRFKMLLCPP
ncbi:MAG: DUF72 domain-containing protein [Chloroflexota bacterium]